MYLKLHTFSRAYGFYFCSTNAEVFKWKDLPYPSIAFPEELSH